MTEYTTYGSGKSGQRTDQKPRVQSAQERSREEEPNIREMYTERKIRRGKSKISSHSKKQDLENSDSDNNPFAMSYKKKPTSFDKLCNLCDENILKKSDHKDDPNYLNAMLQSLKTYNDEYLPSTETKTCENLKRKENLSMIMHEHKKLIEHGIDPEDLAIALSFSIDKHFNNNNKRINNEASSSSSSSNIKSKEKNFLEKQSKTYDHKLVEILKKLDNRCSSKELIVSGIDENTARLIWDVYRHGFSKGILSLLEKK